MHDYRGELDTAVMHGLQHPPYRLVSSRVVVRQHTTPPRRCTECGLHTVQPFLDHGLQPRANGFLVPAQTGDEQRWPIAYGFCTDCFLVQLLPGGPPADVLFAAEYPFLTGSSQTMRDYYAEMAKTLRTRWIPRHVIEIGCNDGTLLQHFRDLPHLGIEPSAGVADLARQKHLRVETRPFSLETACQIAVDASSTAPSLYERVPRNVDLILACHVLTHCASLSDVLRGVDVLLAPSGVLVLEDASLDAVVTDGDFAQFYDEHTYVFSFPALVATLARAQFEVVDVEAVPVHGGSLRVTAVRAGGSHLWRREKKPAVAARLQWERYLCYPHTMRAFAQSADNRVAQLRELLLSYRARGCRIAGYGASSKLSLTLNRLALPPGTLEYVSDTTATKIGREMPGTHEPIISRAEAETRLPDVFLLGAYVHRDWVLEHEFPFVEGGGRFVVWTPSVRAIGSRELVPA